jgi:hypothetical protein
MDMEFKKRGLILTVIFLGILFGVILISASRLPTVGGDNSTWGDILNDYLTKIAGENATQLNETMVNGTNIYSSSINTTHILDGTLNDDDISDSTNLTIGQKLVFAFGEFIDNIEDGWIRITGNLNVTGDANIEGNLTANNFYGGMWYESDTGYNPGLSGVGVSVNLTNFTSDLNNGFSFSDNRTLIVKKEGVYTINFQVNFNGPGTGDWDWGVAIDGVYDHSKCFSHSSGQDTGHDVSASSTCLRRLNANSSINLQLHDDASPVHAVTIKHQELTVIRVGN